jgi:CelD/BcsL family acetyltransferase involved in cellulose biosynthesis
VLVVDCFSALEQLEAIRARWTELYEIDMHANFFLSWEWLHASLATERTPWVILGVRDGEGPYLAFLPLSYRRFPARGPVLSHELSLAGTPRADLTGMLGVAGEERHFIPALAREIKNLPWDTFTLSDYADTRLATLVHELDANGCHTALGEKTPCPFIELPPTWDEYVDSRSHATRRTIRAKLRKIESLPGYRLHFAPPGEAGDAIQTLLRMNSVRWRKDLRIWQRLFSDLFARCYASGRFLIGAMYHGETLMAIQGSFIEPQTRTLLGYMMGYNEEYSRFSPGMMLICASIRYAIEASYQRYDLSRGGQAYKISLATNVHYRAHAAASRGGVRGALVEARRRGLSAVKRMARGLLAPPTSTQAR